MKIQHAQWIEFEEFNNKIPQDCYHLRCDTRDFWCIYYTRKDRATPKADKPALDSIDENTPGLLDSPFPYLEELYNKTGKNTYDFRIMSFEGYTDEWFKYLDFYKTEWGWAVLCDGKLLDTEVFSPEKVVVTCQDK